MYVQITGVVTAMQKVKQLNEGTKVCSLPSLTKSIRNTFHTGPSRNNSPTLAVSYQVSMMYDKQDYSDVDMGTNVGVNPHLVHSNGPIREPSNWAFLYKNRIKVSFLMKLRIRDKLSIGKSLRDFK